MDTTHQTPSRFFNVTARLSDGPGKDAAFRGWTFFRGARWSFVAPRRVRAFLNVPVTGTMLRRTHSLALCA